MSKSQRITLTSMLVMLLLAASSYAVDGRIAISSDGNWHDRDDICASAVSIAILAKSGNASKLVYYGHSDHIWETSNAREEEMRKSTVETAKKYGGFNLSAFYNAKDQTNAAINALAAEINKSSASNPLWILGAGPMEMIGRAIAKSDKSKRKYVTVISHSSWNDKHASRDHNGYNYYDFDDMGCKLKHLKDQNPGTNRPYSEYYWMRDSSDSKLRWLWDRGKVAGKSNYDPSDAGMTYWLVTGGMNGGDQDANPTKLKKMLSGTTTNKPPTCSFNTPNNGDVLKQSDPLYVKVNASDTDGNVSNVKLYLDGKLVRQENASPYEWSDSALQNLSAASHTLKATAIDNDGATTSKSITITVDDGIKTYLAIPGVIQGEDYRGGGEGVGYHDTTSGNTGKAYRTDDVDIQVTSDAGGGYSVGWVAKGEWLAYDVDIASAGNYKITCRVASGQSSDKSMHVEIDGSNVTGAIKFNTGGAGWQSWKNVVVSNVSLPAGKHTLRIAMDTESFNLNYIDIQSDQSTGPIVSFGTPSNGDSYAVGADLYVKVNASSNAGIGNVKLYVNDVFVRQEGVNPYEWGAPNQNDPLLQNMQAGTYILKATATDKSGATATKQITVTVGSSVDPDAVVTHDAYLQAGTRFNDGLLKIEAGKRVAYIKFNVSDLQGPPSSAKLKLKVAGDGGNGTIRVYKGSHNNWTETNLSTSNAPAAGAQIASRTGSWSVGSTYTFELKSMIAGDGDYSIVIKMDSGGNDAWFGSDESSDKPVIEITQ